MMKVSVIVPAYNEEKYLPETLNHIDRALSLIPHASETIVVDNGSVDQTPHVAESCGAKVVPESERNISRARNAGAAHSTGEVMIFVDADTLVPEALFRKIAGVMEDAQCFGGAVSVEYAALRRRWARVYLLGWKFWGRFFNMKQGAAQFCRRPVFEALGGYDTTIFMGEDVDFYWRMSQYARQHGGYVRFVEHPRVVTSARRFDKMGFWRTLLLTHPMFLYLMRRKQSVWKDWYDRAVR